MTTNSNKLLLFYPEVPHPRTIISKICQTLGYDCSNELKLEHLLGFKWKDQTYYAIENQVASLLTHLTIFNSKCINISKNHVYRTYSSVFGNSLAVDPLVFTGSIVCKSNRNAAHDGVVLQGPIKFSDLDKSYCILVDNSSGSDVVDYRVPIFLNRIPTVYVKCREKSIRFSNKNSQVSLVSPQEVFNASEISNLLSFASAIGMEYGELDVLRDRDSQLIYVVDANNTPFGPPNGLSDADSFHLLELLCNCFEETFIAHESSNKN